MMSCKALLIKNGEFQSKMVKTVQWGPPIRYNSIQGGLRKPGNSPAVEFIVCNSIIFFLGPVNSFFFSLSLIFNDNSYVSKCNLV